MNPEAIALLEIKDLVTVFDTDQGPLRAVDDISLHIAPGETVGLVGESGCGKSMTALSILRLLPEGTARILKGAVRFKGENIFEMGVERLRKIRGNQISMIFQDPMTSLNPVFRIGTQIEEAFILHQHLDRVAARAKSIEALREVGIPDADSRIDDYPHQFSGGQRQRIMIAMALACRPALLIADEPTTALDVTIQAQILKLLASLRQQHQMSILLITHDLAILSEFADRIMLMYAGYIVEVAQVADLFTRPLHPYALGLLKSLPAYSEADEPQSDQPLYTIPGAVPDLRRLPGGCRFSNRCVYAKMHCKLREPELEEVEKNHWVRCWEWKTILAESGKA